MLDSIRLFVHVLDDSILYNYERSHMNKVTKYEWQILCLFLIALNFNNQYLHLPIILMGVYYAIGMLFEFLTQSLWDYNVALKKSPFTIKNKDINWIFGLGWLSAVILGFVLGNYLECLIPNKPIRMILGFTIIGNILENVFYYFDLWKYNTTHPLLKVPPYIGKYIVIFKIPLAVRAGYPVLGTIAYYLYVYLGKYL